ncbi:14216_t:CDS:2, partial [Funneliformis geosporum]
MQLIDLLLLLELDISYYDYAGTRSTQERIMRKELDYIKASETFFSTSGLEPTTFTLVSGG